MNCKNRQNKAKKCPIWPNGLYFLFEDMKNHEKDKSAAFRLICMLDQAVYPPSYLSPVYLTTAQQHQILEYCVQNGESIRSAFQKRFLKRSERGVGETALHQHSNNAHFDSKPSSSSSLFIPSFFSSSSNQEETRCQAVESSICGPHVLVPWYKHHLRMSKPNSKILKEYRIWSKSWENEINLTHS